MILNSLLKKIIATLVRQIIYKHTQMIKKNSACCLVFIIGNLFLLFPVFVSAQLNYHLIYKDSSSSLIKISIQSSAPLTAPFSFIMPRSVPGGYNIFIYDRFIENINAVLELRDTKTRRARQELLKKIAA